jgi:phosphatidylglycerophosphate synthase
MKNNKYTFEYLLKRNTNFTTIDAYAKIMVVPLRTVLSWVIMNYTSLTANVVTYIGMAAGVLGAVLSIKYGLVSILIGFLVFYVLDFVDGTMARAYGTSSPSGLKLDMFTDRFILGVTVFALIAYHLRVGHQSTEILLILFYYFLFVMLDTSQLAGYAARVKFGLEHENAPSPQNLEINNTLANCFNPMAWLPTRLSSYLFIIIVYVMTGSFIYAYIAGIICVMSDVFKSRLGFIKRVLKMA